MANLNLKQFKEFVLRNPGAKATGRDVDPDTYLPVVIYRMPTYNNRFDVYRVDMEVITQYKRLEDFKSLIRGARHETILQGN